MSILKSTKKDIEFILKSDPAIDSSQKFGLKDYISIFVIYPSVKATMMHRISHKIHNAGFQFIARMMSQTTRFFTGIEIHPGAQIGEEIFIDHGMGVVIGGTAIVGNRVTMLHGVTLGAKDGNATGKRHPTVGNDVYIGAGAKIIGPLMINDGTVIGANAVVTKEFPANSTIVGVPGRAVEKNKSSQNVQINTTNNTIVSSKENDVEYVI